jgi:hypothetical protein
MSFNCVPKLCGGSSTPAPADAVSYPRYSFFDTTPGQCRTLALYRNESAGLIDKRITQYGNGRILEVSELIDLIRKDILNLGDLERNKGPKIGCYQTATSEALDNLEEGLLAIDGLKKISRLLRDTPICQRLSGFNGLSKGVSKVFPEHKSSIALKKEAELRIENYDDRMGECGNGIRVESYESESMLVQFTDKKPLWKKVMPRSYRTVGNVKRSLRSYTLEITSEGIIAKKLKTDAMTGLKVFLRVTRRKSRKYKKK